MRKSGVAASLLESARDEARVCDVPEERACLGATASLGSERFGRVDADAAGVEQRVGATVDDGEHVAVRRGRLQVAVAAESEELEACLPHEPGQSAYKPAVV